MNNILSQLENYVLDNADDVAKAMAQIRKNQGKTRAYKISPHSRVEGEDCIK